MGKSSCCRAIIWRIGQRRRRCSVCRRDWRIRAKKRGRRALRTSERLLDRVLLEGRSLTEIARQSGLTRQALSYRFTRALERSLLGFQAAQPQHEPDLTLLADGLWFRFKRRPWVLYLMALKESGSHKAIFVDPVMQSGSESRNRWINALQTIPAEKRTRIRALVCDNFGGCMTIARKNAWVLQLCNFHLLASMQRRLGRLRPRGVAQKELREQGFRLVKAALLEPNENSLRVLALELVQLAGHPSMPRKFADIIREFIRRIDNYRAYRLHPGLQLPRTTGSVESKGRSIRDLIRKSRGLRTPKAVALWVTKYLRMCPEIACRPAQFYAN